MSGEQSASKQGKVHSGGDNQTPPEVKVRIYKDATDYVLLASLGGGAMGRYEANHEYYHQKDLSTLPDSPTLHSEVFDTNESESTLNTFFWDTTAAIDFPRGGAVWNEGTRTTPTGCTGTLYRLPNPDSTSGHHLGLMLEIDAENQLQSVVVYKEISTSTAAWANTGFTRTLTKMTGTDPRALDTAVSVWTYTVMSNPQ